MGGVVRIPSGGVSSLAFRLAFGFGGGLAVSARGARASRQGLFDYERTIGSMGVMGGISYTIFRYPGGVHRYLMRVRVAWLSIRALFSMVSIGH